MRCEKNEHFPKKKKKNKRERDTIEIYLVDFFVTTEQQKFKGKYRKTSHRLKEYDYSKEGAYFITICCKDRECLFGEITNGKMMYNEYGKISDFEWKNTENIRKNVTIDEYIIMPDHVHGIIFIDYQIPDEPHQTTETSRRDTVHRVSTPPIFCNEKNTTANREQFGKPTKNSIPTIIRSYKATVTTQINAKRNIHGFPIWQPGFYDRIIRDEEELNRIREYIIQNPQNWENNKNRPENIYF